jgi:hypothetical protein
LRKEFVGTNGENSLETRIHRELTRKKNGTYFTVKKSELGFIGFLGMDRIWGKGEGWRKSDREQASGHKVYNFAF